MDIGVVCDVLLAVAGTAWRGLSMHFDLLDRGCISVRYDQGGSLSPLSCGGT